MSGKRKARVALIIPLLLMLQLCLIPCAAASTDAPLKLTEGDILYSGVGICGSTLVDVVFIYNSKKQSIRDFRKAEYCPKPVSEIESMPTKDTAKVKRDGTFMMKDYFSGTIMPDGRATGNVKVVLQSVLLRFHSGATEWVADPVDAAQFSAKPVLGSDVGSLMQCIGHPDSRVRRRVVQAIGAIGSTEAVVALIETLHDKRSDIRWNAARILSTVSDERIIEPLIGSLSDEHYGVRWNAARALGMIGDPRATEALFKAATDSHSDVRWHAADALGRINDPRAAEFLMNGLRSGNMEIALAARMFFFRQKLGGLETTMIQALDQYGDLLSATDFLNSGNPLLVEAAKKWAKAHGYVVR